MTENWKLHKAICSAFYNISQRNFGILLILSCSFKLWWNFCLDLFRSKFSLLRKWSIESKNQLKFFDSFTWIKGLRCRKLHAVVSIALIYASEIDHWKLTTAVYKDRLNQSSASPTWNSLCPSPLHWDTGYTWKWHACKCYVLYLI
jgi:hypothetical protein